MTSDYRSAPSKEIAPLELRYVPFNWTAPLRVAIFVVGITWVASKKSGLPMLEHFAIGAVFIALLAFISFPVIVVRAAFEGGEIVLRCSRWPSAQVVWSLSPSEARAFIVEEQKKHSRLALETTDGRALGLSQHLYSDSFGAHNRAVKRLAAWLAELQ